MQQISAELKSLVIAHGNGRWQSSESRRNLGGWTCFDACAELWEPVLAGKNGVKILSNKINRAAVGSIDRPEGKQLTLNGWPLYYFHKDKLLGQTAGYGVGNVWFAIAPNGKKAARCP